MVTEVERWHVSIDEGAAPRLQAFLRAGQQAGQVLNPDYNGYRQEGIQHSPGQHRSRRYATALGAPHAQGWLAPPRAATSKSG